MDYKDISLAMENQLQERIERETSYYDEEPEEYDPYYEAESRWELEDER